MVVLDTHIWIYYVSNRESELSDNQLRAIHDNIDSGLAVSVISCWEIAKKNSLGKLDLGEDRKNWIDKALSFVGIKSISLTPDIILDSVELDWYHKDPMDQLIVSTARCLRCPLVTKDDKILKYSGVDTIV